MALQVYDYRNDLRNVLVTPRIRARFVRMEPGSEASLHSHDLGHEIFLVLQGRALFVIDGEQAEVGPGQMCIALADQPHRVRALGDRPMIMYLSVTPHLHPTHTGRNDDGSRRPLHFASNRAYDVESDPAVSTGMLADALVAASQSLAAVARKSAGEHQTEAARLKQALADGDREAAEMARNAMWDGVCRLFEQIDALGEVWNELAPRVTETA